MSATGSAPAATRDCSSNDGGEDAKASKIRIAQIKAGCAVLTSLNGDLGWVGHLTHPQANADAEEQRAGCLAGRSVPIDAAALALAAKRM